MYFSDCSGINGAGLVGFAVWVGSRVKVGGGGEVRVDIGSVVNTAVGSLVVVGNARLRGRAGVSCEDGVRLSVACVQLITTVMQSNKPNHRGNLFNIRFIAPHF
jgi:hypothetical protein